MKLIEPKVEIIQQEPNLEGVYKQIEQAARTCYKSEDKITDTSAKEFVDKLIKNKHLAMLEHGTVYLNIFPEDDFCEEIIGVFIHNPYTKCIRIMNNNFGYLITTNFRVIVENNLDAAIEYICEPTECHEKRYTLKFTTSIGITRELIRHRCFSFANESTRYCNYSRDKFNNEITFVIPSWVDRNREPNDVGDLMFLDICHKTEKYYLDLISDGYSPQQAREVLPLCTKSELVMTGFESDWKEFFDKRLKGTTGKPHPDMIHLCELAQEELTKNGIIL